jgi:hypothetical protein
MRELAMRVGSGDVQAPTAAKVAAVGIGTALFAGGALAPKLIGVGHAPSAATHVLRPAAHHIVEAAPPEAPVGLVPTSTGAHLAEGRAQTVDVSDRSKVFSDAVHTSDGSEREGENSTGAATRHDDSSDPTAASNNRTSDSTDDPSGQDDGTSDDSRTDGTTTSTTTTGTTNSGATTTGTTTTYPVTTDD